MKIFNPNSNECEKFLATHKSIVFVNSEDKSIGLNKTNILTKEYGVSELQKFSAFIKHTQKFHKGEPEGFMEPENVKGKQKILMKFNDLDKKDQKNIIQTFPSRIKEFS